MDDIDVFQSNLYNEVELPRLKLLIETRIKKEGNQKKFIAYLNTNLDALGWPNFSAPTISIIRNADDTSNRTTGWDERRLFRLAVGLGLDPDPVIALAILRCYLLGLIELSSESIVAFKSTISSSKNNSNFRNLVNAIEVDHPKALLQLMIHTPLTEARVNDLLDGSPFEPEEIELVVQWAQKFDVMVPVSLLSENHQS